MKWEYKVVQARLRDGEVTETVLNELGQQGWELVTVNSMPAADSILVFKRPV